jgi:glycine cleavage system H lipoate-binding protein
MPAMSGIDVAKSVKHLRPDTDVVIITGFASVESAVECMKYGALDYIEKPFTEDELRLFVKRARIKRQDRMQKQLKPAVHIMDPAETDQDTVAEFSIPGGVHVSAGHCWVSLAEDGAARVGLDDFARKLLGSVDSINFPNVGMTVTAGNPLFRVTQGSRKAPFHTPLSGKIVMINEALGKNCAKLEDTPYGRNWICVIEGNNLDAELPRLKIGKSAITLFQEDIDRFQAFFKKAQGNGDSGSLSIGMLQKLDDASWDRAAKEFFGR